MALTSRPIPVFSSANSSVLTSAILVSGTVPVWGDVGAGPAGVVRGCAKTDPALIAARKATAAIARNIFISLFCNTPYFEGDQTTCWLCTPPVLVCRFG